MTKCDYEITPRVERLEQHMFGHAQSNTAGVHPVVFGDHNEKQGLVGDMRELKFYAKIIIAIVCVFGSAILVALANLAVGKAAGSGNTVTQSVITSDDAAMKPGTYTTAQLAAKLQLSVREIQDRAANREIPGAWKDGKSWRFDQPSIDAWLAACAESAVTAAPAAPADQN